MELRACPNCGAPLPAGAPDAVESCRFCGVEGRTRAPAAPDAKLAAAQEPPYHPTDKTIEQLCRRYVDNVRAYTHKAKVGDVDPDERLMRAVEDKMDIPDSRRAEFRGVLMEFVDALSVQGKPFDHQSNPRLGLALEKVLRDGNDAL
jgi:hypothetical protein